MSETKTFEEKQAEAKKRAEAQMRLIKPQKQKDEEPVENEPNENEINENEVIANDIIDNQEAIEELEAEEKVVATIDDVIESAFREFIKGDKANGETVKTTFVMDSDIGEKLDEICYKKKGLKSTIINTAIRFIIENGKAERMANEYDRMRRLKDNYDKRFYDKLFDKLEIEK